MRLLQTDAAAVAAVRPDSRPGEAPPDEKLRGEEDCPAGHDPWDPSPRLRRMTLPTWMTQHLRRTVHSSSLTVSGVFQWVK